MNSKLKEILNKKAKTLERKRKAILVWAKVYKIVIVPIKVILRASCFILSIVCLLFPPTLIYLIVVGIAYLLLEIFNNPLTVYQEKIKKNILPYIYKQLNPSITYYSSAIKRDFISESHLFSQLYFNKKTHIEGDDYLTGTINNKEFIVNEIQIFKEVVDYGKTIGGCLFSILLFPIYIIKNLSVDLVNQQDIPLSGIEYKKNVFHKGLFFKVLKVNDFKGKAIIIPKKMDLENKISTTFFGKKQPDAISQYITTNYNS